MQSKVIAMLSLFLCLAGAAFSADIVITGETDVNSSRDFTYYATPVTAGAVYTWETYGTTIVAQNTDPNAGPIFCTVHFASFLGQSAISISDDQGNSGILYLTVYGLSLAKVFEKEAGEQVVCLV